MPRETPLPRPLLCLLTVLLFAALSLPATAAARSRTTVIVRDGSWVGTAPGIGSDPPDVAILNVHHHSLQKLHFSAILHCHDSISGEYDKALFQSGRGFPGHSIPRSGRFTVGWEDHDGQRSGSVTGDFDFTVHAKATFVVITRVTTPTSDVSCSGIGIVRLTHPHVVIPLP